MAPAIRVLLLAVAVTSFTLSSSAQELPLVPHDIGSDDIEKIATYKKGQVITFYSPEGDLIKATFVGQISKGSATESARFQVENVITVAPPGGGGLQQPGTPAQGTPNGPGAGAGQGQSREGGATSGGSSAVGAFGGAALVGIGAYIAIPPSLREELKERSGALQAAITDGRITIQKYQTTLEKSVAGAEIGLRGLRDVSKGKAFEVPAPLALGTPLPMPEFPNASDGLRQSLVSSYVALSTTRAPSVAHAEIRATGLHAVAFAQSSLRNGILPEATAAAEIARAAAAVLTQTADLLIAFNPLTSMARDATELITGRDLFSGKELSEGDMWLRGVSLGVSLVTAGVGSTVRQSISAIAPMIDEANGLRKLLDRTLDVTPHMYERWWRAKKVLGVADGEHAIRDVAYEAITRGKAYWDLSEPNTVAFFVRTDQNYLRFIINVREGKAVTVVTDKLSYSFPRTRWIPLDDVPLKAINGDPIKLFLPGGGPP